MSYYHVNCPHCSGSVSVFVSELPSSPQFITATPGPTTATLDTRIDPPGYPD